MYLAISIVCGHIAAVYSWNNISARLWPYCRC